MDAIAWAWRHGAKKQAEEWVRIYEDYEGALANLRGTKRDSWGLLVPRIGLSIAKEAMRSRAPIHPLLARATYQDNTVELKSAETRIDQLMMTTRYGALSGKTTTKRYWNPTWVRPEAQDEITAFAAVMARGDPAPESEPEADQQPEGYEP